MGGLGYGWRLQGSSWTLLFISVASLAFYILNEDGYAKWSRPCCAQTVDLGRQESLGLSCTSSKIYEIILI